MVEQMNDSVLRKAIWDAIEARIDDAYPDGIAANGEFNNHVYDQQRAYINGMRAARLTAINAAERSILPSNLDAATPERVK